MSSSQSVFPFSPEALSDTAGAGAGAAAGTTFEAAFGCVGAGAGLDDALRPSAASLRWYMAARLLASSYWGPNFEAIALTQAPRV